MTQKNAPTQKREYLTVEAVFGLVSETAVMYFDHYTKEYKGQRRELDEYLEKLRVDGWKLTIASNICDRGTYQCRRYHFR